MEAKEAKMGTIATYIEANRDNHIQSLLDGLADSGCCDV
jgi:hypothetical protein